MKKSLFKSFFLLALGFLAFSFSLSTSTATFFDEEIIEGNQIISGTLDIALTSGQNNFVSGADDLQPSDSVARDIYITSESGSLPLKHQVSYLFQDGDPDFCGQLNLKIWYNHHDGPYAPGHPNRDMRLVYNAPLTSLSELQNEDFLIPHPNDEYDSNSSDGLTQWYFYQIEMPPVGEIDSSFQNQTCNFDFIIDAWQAELSSPSAGFSDTESLNSVLQSGIWDDGDNPGSSITTTLAIQPSNPSFDIQYQASDTTVVSAVELYYSYQGGDWIYFTTDHPTPGPSVSGTFTFTTSHGDGIYRFKTIAIDIFNNTEEKTDPDYETLLDTTPPVITASLGEFDLDRTTPSFIENFDFEVTPTPPVDPLDPWTTESSNPAQLQDTPPSWSTLRDDQSVLLTISDPSAGSILSSDFSIPSASTDTLLSFWYNLNLLNGSDDSDFVVRISETADPANHETVLIHANENPLSRYVSDWHELSFQMTNWHGQDVTIEFILSDTFVVPDAQVLIDDITLSQTPHSVSSAKTILFNSYDYGSGFLPDGSGLPLSSEYKIDDGSWIQITGPVDPPSGSHIVYYHTTDEAGHSSGELRLDLINGLGPFGPEETALLIPEIDPTSTASPIPTPTPACPVFSLQNENDQELSICVQADLIDEDRALQLTFSDLPEEGELEYQAIYLYEDQEQAVFRQESLPVDDNALIRQLELATCSGQTCIYHYPEEITLELTIYQLDQEFIGQKLFTF